MQGALRAASAEGGFVERRPVSAAAGLGPVAVRLQAGRGDPDNPLIFPEVRVSIPVQGRAAAGAGPKVRARPLPARIRGGGARRRPDCGVDDRSGRNAAPESRPNVRNQNNVCCRERLPNTLMERQSRLSSDRRVAGTTRLFECTRMHLSGAMFSSSYRARALLNLWIGCDSLKLQVLAPRRCTSAPPQGD